MDYCRIFAYALICIAIVLGEEIKNEKTVQPQVVLTSEVSKEPESFVKDDTVKKTELNLKVESTSVNNASVNHDDVIKVPAVDDDKIKPIKHENSMEFLNVQQVPPKRKTRQIYINKKFLTLQALQDNDDKNPEPRTVLITLTTLGLAKKWLLLRLKKRFVFPFLFRSTGDAAQDSVADPNNVLYIDRRHIAKLNQLNSDEQDVQQGRAENVDEDSDENYFGKQSEMLRQLNRLKSINNERRFLQNKYKLKRRRNF